MSELGARARSRRADTGLIVLTALIWVAAAAVVAFAWDRGNAQPPDGSTMAFVPTGTYPVGFDGDPATYAQPTSVTVNAFFIDRREVTNAEFAASSAAPAADWTDGAPPAGDAELAVDAVSWQQAFDYCAALGKRLPTEAEWEAAGRGLSGLRYPFPGGATRIGPLTRLDAETDGRSTASVFGAQQMFGGVWEWVGEPYVATTDGSRTLKGGSDSQQTDLAYRLSSSGAPTASVGFRCAADAVRDGTEPTFAPVVLDDDFSDPASGWLTFETAEIGVSYVGSGFLRFSVRSPGQGAIVPAALADLSDVEMEVTTSVTGPTGGEHRFGIALRAAEGRALLFLVEDGGSAWSVQRLEGGRLQALAEGALAEEPRSGWRLRARVIGDVLTFEIDGEVVAQVGGVDLASGSVGLYVETLDSPEIDVTFDDAIVRSGAGRDFIDRG